MTETTVRTVQSLPRDWEVVRLAQTLCQHLPVLKDRYGIQTLKLFGSYVRNEQLPSSDLDVLVTLSHTPSLFDRVALRDDLSDALGIPVDVALRDYLQPRLARYILREAIDL